MQRISETKTTDQQPLADLHFPLQRHLQLQEPVPGAATLPAAGHHILARTRGGKRAGDRLGPHHVLPLSTGHSAGAAVSNSNERR